MKIPRQILLFPLFALSISCNKEEGWDCLKKLGDEKTELRSLADFDQIFIEDKIDVILEPSAVYEAEVVFGENILPKITTEVIDGKLFLRNTATCDMVRNLSERPKITVRFPQLRYVEYSGSGDISCSDTLRGNKFTFAQWEGSGSVNILSACDSLSILLHTGHGQVIAAGKSYIAEYYSNAIGPIDASAVKTKLALVNNSGVNDIRLSVSDYLYVQIEGSGNVFYQGAPAIDRAGNGKGSLIPY